MGLIEFHPTDIPISCSIEVAPILEVIFKHAVTEHRRIIPSDWLTVNICPSCLKFKKVTCSIPSNYRPISQTASCCKVTDGAYNFPFNNMDHITF